jgi:hypothetical protein
MRWKLTKWVFAYVAGLYSTIDNMIKVTDAEILLHEEKWRNLKEETREEYVLIADEASKRMRLELKKE